VIRRLGKSIVDFFDGVAKVAGALAAVLALTIWGGTQWPPGPDPDPDPEPAPVHARKAACSNRIDDDGDGKTDFAGHDSGCSSPEDRSEKNPACSDGKDNDGDGEIDFAGHDLDCSSATDPSEKNPACSDRKDNDGDGEIDFGHDPECSSPEDRTEK
jgi:hypothetical protein